MPSVLLSASGKTSEQKMHTDWTEGTILSMFKHSVTLYIENGKNGQTHQKKTCNSLTTEKWIKTSFKSYLVPLYEHKQHDNSPLKMGFSINSRLCSKL